MALPATYEAKIYRVILRIEKREINPKPPRRCRLRCPLPLLPAAPSCRQTSSWSLLSPPPLFLLPLVCNYRASVRFIGSGGTPHQHCAALSKAVLVGVVVSSLSLLPLSFSLPSSLVVALCHEGMGCLRQSLCLNLLVLRRRRRRSGTT